MENNHQPLQTRKPGYIYCQTKHQAATWACDTSAFMFSGLNGWDVTFHSLFELWMFSPILLDPWVWPWSNNQIENDYLSLGGGAVWLSVIAHFNDNIADHTAQLLSSNFIYAHLAHDFLILKQGFGTVFTKCLILRSANISKQRVSSCKNLP